VVEADSFEEGGAGVGAGVSRRWQASSNSGSNDTQIPVDCLGIAAGYGR
jgi:hypothetical protein